MALGKVLKGRERCGIISTVTSLKRSVTSSKKNDIFAKLITSVSSDQFQYDL